MLDGPINRLAFETYVEEVLVSELRSGNVVIMDNLSIQEGTEVRERIEAAGAELLFVPRYTDCDPIQLAFSRLKRTAGKLEKQMSA